VVAAAVTAGNGGAPVKDMIGINFYRRESCYYYYYYFPLKRLKRGV
jgi:hypothetical protein